MEQTNVVIVIVSLLVIIIILFVYMIKLQIEEIRSIVKITKEYEEEPIFRHNLPKPTIKPPPISIKDIKKTPSKRHIPEP